jgi:CRP/FNR family transcriptional regulator, cyclic AMP receptor protein
MERNNEFLKYAPIFLDLGEDQLDKIDGVGSHIKHKKGSVILFEHEESGGLYIIAKGKVKVSCYSDDGREVILAILNESDIFGEMSLLDGYPSSATVTATEDSEIFLIKRGDFLELLKSNHDVVLSMLQELTRRLRAADTKIKALSMKDSEGKIATVLIQLADEIGKIAHGKVEIERLPFQYNLANMAGTSRETISRTLNTFTKKGYVELEGSRLRILNFEKFKEAYV